MGPSREQALLATGSLTLLPHSLRKSICFSHLASARAAEPATRAEQLASACIRLIVVRVPFPPDLFFGHHSHST